MAKNQLPEFCRTWHNAKLDKNPIVTVRNAEPIAWLRDGRIWQVGEERRMHVVDAFELYVSGEHKIEFVRAHIWSDPMIERAKNPELVWPLVTDANEQLPSIQRAVATCGKTADGKTHRMEPNWYIEDNPDHVTADVLRQFGDFFSHRCYPEGEGRFMYPEEYERGKMLGYVCDRAVRMRVTTTMIYYKLGRQDVRYKQGTYFLAEPSHAAELESKGWAKRVGAAEWEKSHPTREYRIESDPDEVKSNVVMSSGFQKFLGRI